MPRPRIAVLVPCYNEEAAIGRVVREFRAALPEAVVYVYDNNSRDRTAEVAQEAGAVVRREPLQGKGSVVRRMFADIEADVYVMADGDATYHAPSAPDMVALMLRDRLDMVVGARVDSETAAYRPMHRVGNRVLTGFVAQLFGRRFSDILSGYRVFSRRFVKSFPALSRGFEIETELTVHALTLRMPIAEIQTPYGVRPAGSLSKLSTFKDGFRILAMILNLFRDQRPSAFFGIVSLVLGLVAIALSTPLFITFMQTGLVPRLPTAVLAASIMLLAFISLAVGLILDNVKFARREMKRLAYLAIPATSDDA
jgi:glycosyltransferase involved in cell wall biosynthesis